jgi:hypothetical protein
MNIKVYIGSDLISSVKFQKQKEEKESNKITLFSGLKGSILELKVFSRTLDI